MTPPAIATGPVLQTARLILRPPALEDFERWAEFQADPETTRFIGGPQAPAQVWRSMMSVAGAWTLTGIGFFSVIEKSSGRWIGRIGPWCPHGWPGREVGWSLHRDAMGKGYALEAAIASLDYAFEVLGWDDVIHAIDPENVASQSLARRLGSVNRGPGRLPPPFEAAVVDLWGQTRADWGINRQRLIG
ncbi:MAG: GNAT family N-acetyltransferase [Brevundimonas sp.]|uniref:GNAT family N-acetyltransferase n=1 Tax=Brevundimonas sp. TaxID=1871086 RepID=UPI002734BC48|nr:GNAT family N-acetyltransferase [Brevundimonas sp.]MDP3404040.1 GNAT family N-acetyltransferase [Brevundimonas sp.]